MEVEDGPTLLHTSFASGYGIYGHTLYQAYPDNLNDPRNPSAGPLYLSGTGASEIRTLGYYLTNNWGDAVYDLSFTFDHSADDLVFNFLGDTDEDINNESWGLDNVKVSVKNTGLANVADSVADFSTTQGQNNWYYGYYDGPFDSSDFVEMSQTGTNASGNHFWNIDEGILTTLYEYGGHASATQPRGFPLRENQWAVRRWVSEVNGEVTIEGRLADLHGLTGNNGNGVAGHIFIDGEEVWSGSVENADFDGISYSINASVSQGSIVDFAIDSLGNDWSDTTLFTAKIFTDDAGQANIPVYLDLNNNGTLDTDEPFQLTQEDDPKTLKDEAGLYKFTDLPPDTYIVHQVIPDTLRQLDPVSHHVVEVGAGEHITDIDFFNQGFIESGTIAGTLWNTTSSHPLIGTELVENGDAETGDTTGWLSTGIEIAPGAASEYGNDIPFELDIGEFAFTGATGNASSQTLTQLINVDSLAEAIDANAITSSFSIWIESLNEGSVSDTGKATLSFLNQNNDILQAQTFIDPIGTNDWNQYTDERLLPIGTRTIQITLDASRNGGISSDAYFDQVSLQLSEEPSGLPGFTVYLDTNDNGILDADEPSQITSADNPDTLDVDESGQYSFSELSFRSYVVRQNLPEGWQQLSPQEDKYEVTVASNQRVEDIDFFNRRNYDPAQLSGIVFEDSDGDGVFDESDTGQAEQTLSERIVYLDQNQNDQRDDHERLFVTNERGEYSFTDLIPGEYTVALDAQVGWIQTLPVQGGHNINLSDVSELTEVNFGTRPDPFTTNLAPEFISTAPTEAFSGELFRYDALAMDPEGGTLSYELLIKPTGMGLDTSTGTLAWIPARSQVGVHDVIVRVEDDQGAVDLQSFQVTVALNNSAPIFTSDLLDQLQPQVGKILTYDADAIDLDGDTLTYSIVDAPNGATIDADNGILTWTPSTTGEAAITLKVTDGNGGEDLQTINLDVIEPLPNRSPSITNTTPRTEIRYEQPYLHQFEAVDPDGDALTYTLVEAPTGMSLSDDGLLSWLPSVSQSGRHDVEVQIGDGNGGVTTVAWTITVSHQSINHAPVITSVPDTRTNLSKGFVYEAEGSDADGDTLLWSLDDAPDGMVVDEFSGQVSWNPESDQIGTHTVQLRATDSFGLYTGQIFEVEVTGVNTPPSIVSQALTQATMTESYRYNVVAVDPEGDEMSFSLGMRPDGMSIDADTGVIRWTPGTSQTGTHDVEVLVQDAQGGLNRQIFNVEVSTESINHAPAIESSPVFRADVGSPYRYQVEATDPDLGDVLSYQLIEAPAGMTIDSNGEIQWDSPVFGNHKVVVGVNDNPAIPNSN